MCTVLFLQAGDAASFFDVTLGRRRIEHHDHAVSYLFIWFISDHSVISSPDCNRSNRWREHGRERKTISPSVYVLVRNSLVDDYQGEKILVLYKRNLKL